MNIQHASKGTQVHKQYTLTYVDVHIGRDTCAQMYQSEFSEKQNQLGMCGCVKRFTIRNCLPQLWRLNGLTRKANSIAPAWVPRPAKWSPFQSGVSSNLSLSLKAEDGCPGLKTSDREFFLVWPLILLSWWGESHPQREGNRFAQRRFRCQSPPGTCSQTHPESRLTKHLSSSWPSQGDV